MEIKGKIHCFFEQSGTFKNEFKKLGYEAFDYDIQNSFGETDYVVDLFNEIENGYDNKPSMFDNITSDDLIISFFPCIYFEAWSMVAFSWGYKNYKKLSYAEKTDRIIEREANRTKFYTLLLKLIRICMSKNIRMILENPYNEQHFFKQGNFVKNPTFIDNNRMIRGDYFVKPTAYWFFNCEKTYGLTTQNDKKQKLILKCKSSNKAGLCSEERSMISPDYARNFICDFIIGKKQNITQLTIF